MKNRKSGVVPERWRPERRYERAMSCLHAPSRTYKKVDKKTPVTMVTRGDDVVIA